MKIDSFHVSGRVFARSGLFSNGVKLISRHIRDFLDLLPLALALAPGVVLAQTSLENPLNPQFSSVPAFIAGALKVLVIVALPIITLFIVVAGFMFVLARGSPEGIKKAKENFIYVIIGATLILGAWLLATLIGGTVAQLVGN